MPDASLVTHPRWPLYKKCRRAAARELGALGLTAGTHDVDTYLATEISNMLQDVHRLYLRDQAVREEWVRIERPAA
jgi:hypothetical protein